MNEKSVADRFSTAILTSWNEFKKICKNNDMREFIDAVWEQNQLEGFLERSEAHGFLQDMMREATGDNNLFIAQDISNQLFV